MRWSCNETGAAASLAGAGRQSCRRRLCAAAAGICDRSEKGDVGLTSIPQKQQRGDAIKPSDTGRYRRKEGRFFPSRPVAWCILVISRLITFINSHIFELTSPKNDESRLNLPHPFVFGFVFQCDGLVVNLLQQIQCFKGVVGAACRLSVVTN